MSDLTIVPVRQLQEIAASRYEKGIDMCVKSIYKRIIKEAKLGAYTYKCWFDTDHDGNMRKEDIESIRRVKELFPGISCIINTVDMKEVVTVFSWSVDQ